MNAKTTRTAVIEGLETRQLMAGTPIDIAWAMGGPAVANSGSQINIQATATNVGTTAVRVWHQEANSIYLSHDRAISSDDIPLQVISSDFRGVALNPGQRLALNATLKIGDGVATGDYYIIAKFADIADKGSTQQFDRNLANNTASTAIHVNLIRANTQMAMVGDTPHGMRGQTAVFKVVLKDASGRLLVDKQVTFYATCAYFGKKQLMTVATNGQGVATLSYPIPANTSADNISLTAVFAGDATANGCSFTVPHLQIGRPL